MRTKQWSAKTSSQLESTTRFRTRIASMPHILFDFTPFGAARRPDHQFRIDATKTGHVRRDTVASMHLEDKLELGG
jgi:hypothetical protein